MEDKHTDPIQLHIKCINEKIDDLLELADIFEEHGVNVEHNGKWVNPVSFIRTKVDVIFEEVEAIRFNLH